MEKLENSLGKQIKIARKKKGVKQYELAELVNVSQNYISLIENGKKIPSMSVLQKIAAVLDVPAGVLISEDTRFDNLKTELIELAKRYNLKEIMQELESLIRSY